MGPREVMHRGAHWVEVTPGGRWSGWCRSDGTRPGDEWELFQSIMGAMAALGGWW